MRYETAVGVGEGGGEIGKRMRTCIQLINERERIPYLVIGKDTRYLSACQNQFSKNGAKSVASNSRWQGPRAFYWPPFKGVYKKCHYKGSKAGGGGGGVRTKIKLMKITEGVGSWTGYSAIDIHAVPDYRGRMATPRDGWIRYGVDFFPIHRL